MSEKCKGVWSTLAVFCLLTVVEASVVEKLNHRSFPSIFAPWSETLVNKPELTFAEMTAYHDLFWSPEFGLRFRKTDDGVELAGDFEHARKQRDRLLALNPNMLFLLEINFRGAAPTSWHLKDLYTDDFPWIVGETGEIVLGSPAEFYQDLLIDFTHPKAQEIIVGQVFAVYESGLWDGIFFDFWNENGVVLEGYRTYEAEQQARVNILKGIRDAVGDDFLIIVNKTGKPTRSVPYINGIFMESFRENLADYTYEGLKVLEEIQLWVEENLREPQINCLEAEGIGSQLSMSPKNLQGMRCLTTLSLTHSDGYIVYTMGVQWDEPHPHDSLHLNYQGAAFHANPPPWIKHREHHETYLHTHHHEHYWYEFWDADLGQPIGEKGKLYNENIGGLFIREFTNGWAVYNRSGQAQDIQLPEVTTGFSSGIKEHLHTVPDLDGEIFLRVQTVKIDVNGDGIVNILDLVIVSNAFGKSKPDLNNDGIVNILDLTLIAKEMR